MISYELAKKLKDAGFIAGSYSKRTNQWYLGEKYVVTGNEINSIEYPGPWRQHLWTIDFAKELVYIPTLAELVEAMPMREKHLDTVNDAHFFLQKLVSTNPEYRAMYVDEDTNEWVEGFQFVGEAETVVAELWIKLRAFHKDRDPENKK